LVNNIRKEFYWNRSTFLIPPATRLSPTGFNFVDLAPWLLTQRAIDLNFKPRLEIQVNAY